MYCYVHCASGVFLCKLPDSTRTNLTSDYVNDVLSDVRRGCSTGTCPGLLKKGMIARSKILKKGTIEWGNFIT